MLDERDDELPRSSVLWGMLCAEFKHRRVHVREGLRKAHKHGLPAAARQPVASPRRLHRRRAWIRRLVRRRDGHGGKLWRISTSTCSVPRYLSSPHGARVVIPNGITTRCMCRASTQPDGGEKLARRKGVGASPGPKESSSKPASRCTKTGYEAPSPHDLSHHGDAHA